MKNTQKQKPEYAKKLSQLDQKQVKGGPDPPDDDDSGPPKPKP